MTATSQTTPAAQVGEVRDIPLNRLKASPRNARRVGHSAQVIEARAASIKAKGLLQPLVVEPEVKEDGGETGYYLVTIGEGRRQALRLLAKRKALPKGAPVRCVIDTTNDPGEISLDENVSRQSKRLGDQERPHAVAGHERQSAFQEVEPS
ncbi:ParB/Srx family N-terminal domain-containing protein [Caulobacter segnis]|uniref:ParB/Srx family N-terminal domain-containing protein n=1 Tax=Caulobacter segnis TaxID=88688 RepID=UPI001CC0E0DD|nr:ParB/Srx family N-terminal domain-containing protein [Caulobacter segnis]